MQMCGGGPFNLFSGQITDDSELAICLMLGLIEGKNTITEEGDCENVMNIDKIS